MIKLLELLKKNFKLIVRAKVSALIIFIGPLLLVSLLGLAYSQSSAFTLTASIFSESYTELSESLITKMTNQNFRILRQDDVDNCIGFLKRGESQACIIFPPDMEISEDKTNEITFYVDYSQINLVWLMLDVMSARVSERSEEISEELAGDILSRMWFVEEKLRSSKSTMSTIKSNGNNVKKASAGMRTSFKKLDITVDFSGLDVGGAEDISQNVSSLLTRINAKAGGLANETKSIIDDIESSVSSIEGETNASSIANDLENIDEAADEIEDAIDNATRGIGLDVANASAHMNNIKDLFEEIGLKFAATKSKISNVKKKRDDLLPQFDTVSADIDDMVSSINSMAADLDEALQKIMVVKGRSAEGIISPITTRIEPVATQKTHFNSLFPALLVLIIMITGVLLPATLVIVEKKSKAFFRNSFTPTSYFTFNLSTYITSLAVLLIQLLLFVSVSAFFFETEVLASIWLILLLVFLTSTVFICIGMFIGFIFKTEETSNLAAITMIAVLLLFSNAVIPLESMPAYIKEIAMFNPFVISELALKQTIIFQLGLERIMYGLGLLAGYAVGIFLLLIIMQNALRRLSFVHFHKFHFSRGIAKEKKAIVKPVRLEPPTKEETGKSTVKEPAVKKESTMKAWINKHLKKTSK